MDLELQVEAADVVLLVAAVDIWWCWPTDEIGEGRARARSCRSLARCRQKAAASASQPAPALERRRSGSTAQLVRNRFAHGLGQLLGPRAKQLRAHASPACYGNFAFATNLGARLRAGRLAPPRAQQPFLAAKLLLLVHRRPIHQYQ